MQSDGEKFACPFKQVSIYIVKTFNMKVFALMVNRDNFVKLSEK